MKDISINIPAQLLEALEDMSVDLISASDVLRALTQAINFSELRSPVPSIEDLN